MQCFVFLLRGTRGTMQVFERQTVLQSVTEFARFRVKRVAQVKNTFFQNFVRTRVNGSYSFIEEQY